MQKKPQSSSYSTWFTETLTARLAVSDTVHLGGRVEYVSDKDRVLFTTSPDEFQTFGASLNLDWEPVSGILFRNEVRTLLSKHPVFTGRDGAKTSNTLAVTSIALSF